MSSAPAYSARVREMFAAPTLAGTLPEAAGTHVVAEAGSPAHGAWVRIEARVCEGRVVDARFRTWGCPHVIAASELVALRMVGSELHAATDFDLHSLAAELELPPSKLGRLLILQDALRRLTAADGASG